MCHMVADTEEELHQMANDIGVRRKWFQPSPKHRYPHYDICKAKRTKAIKRGAVILVSSRAFIMQCRRINGK